MGHTKAYKTSLDQELTAIVSPTTNKRLVPNYTLLHVNIYLLVWPKNIMGTNERNKLCMTIFLTSPLKQGMA